MAIDFSKYPLPRRLRHHTHPNLYFPLNQLKERPKYYPPLIDSINWKNFYSNAKPPDMLDIGCGKGRFLIEMAQSNNDKNILGIEVRKTLVDWLNDIISGESIGNCNVIWYSVVNGLKFIDAETIEAVFYLFPDPWPKKKHQKRRAFNEHFLDEIYRILKNDAKLYLASDVDEVNEYHMDLLNNDKRWEVILNPDENDWPWPITNKEKFCRSENISFNRIIATKK